MRAKLKVNEVLVHETCDVVRFQAVCKSESYGNDGLDENNTFAKFSPSAALEITIANPDLLGKFRPGQTFYVDFTPAEA
jgi:hypothetical protein